MPKPPGTVSPNRERRGGEDAILVQTLYIRSLIDGYHNPMRPGPQYSHFRVGETEGQRGEETEQRPIGREWWGWAGSKPIRPQSPATVLNQAPPSYRNDFRHASLEGREPLLPITDNEGISRRQLPTPYLARPVSPRLSWDHLGNTEQGQWGLSFPAKKKEAGLDLCLHTLLLGTLGGRKCYISCICNGKP